MQRITLLLAAVVVCATPLAAQTRTVTGTITDVESREPLGGAQIGVKGSPSLRATARENGSFAITVPTQDIVLVVRRIGYPLREVPVSATTASVEIALRGLIALAKPG